MEPQTSADDIPWRRAVGVVLVLAAIHFILFLVCVANCGPLGSAPGEPDDYDRPITVVGTIGTIALSFPLVWLAAPAGVSGIGWLIPFGLNSLLWGAGGLGVYSLIKKITWGATNGTDPPFSGK